MANTASRLSANGSLTISGTFDEVVGGVTTRGLVAYLDANKVESYPGYGKTWIDLSGNKNDGAINGNVVFVANGTSSYFNWPTIQNDSNYISGANSFNYQDFTIVFYPDPASTYAFVTLFSTAPASAQNDKSLRAQSQGSGAQWYISNSGDGNDWSSNAVAANTVYYLNGSIAPPVNISSVYKGIYINAGTWNILGGSKSTNQFPSSWSYYLGSGGYPGRGWQGRIAAALFYDRPLSQSEQIKNYNYFAKQFGIATNTTPTVSQITANSTTNIIQYQSNNFDEVTYNPNSNVVVNLFPYSEDFTQSFWGKTNCTITTNAAIAPDGKQTATKVVESITTSNKEINTLGFSVVGGIPYTISCYVKAAERSEFRFGLTTEAFSGSTNAYFNLATGTTDFLNGGYTSSSIINVGNGWYRCIATFVPIITRTMNAYLTLSAAGSTNTNYTGDGSSGLYIWGFQLEQAINSPIYVQTIANAVIANTFNQRTTSTGNTFIKGTYDEYSKMSPITEGLIFNIDPGYDASYTGSGSTMYDTTQNKYVVNLTAGGSSPTYSSDYGGILKFTSTFGNNAWANTNIPTRIITPTSNYTMSAWIKLNRSNSGLAEYNFYNFSTGTIVSPQANTGYAYGSAGTILGPNYYGDYGLFWYSRIGNAGAKEILIGFQNRVTPYAEASPQLTYTMNDSLIFFNWTHIVGVLNNAGNFAGFYVNGVLVSSTTASQIASGSFPYTIPTVRICADNVAGGNALGRNFDGDIGPMSIWNRALSDTEVQQMYSSQRSRFGV